MSDMSEMVAQTIDVMMIDSLNRGYLATNQLTNVISQSQPHLEATVVTTLSKERRKFSWLWDSTGNRPLLVNLLTGTLFCPESGRSLNSSPRLEEAPFPVPPLMPSKRLPLGVFSTN